MGLSFADELLEEAALTSLSFFVTEDEPLINVKISRHQEDSNIGVDVKCQGDTVNVDTDHFRTNIDFSDSTAEIIFKHEVNSTIMLNAIKNFFVFCVLRMGGIVLHASAVARDGQAYVFTGPSGSGKSTVADNSSDHTVLSEEVVAIVSNSQQCRVFALPYNGDQRFQNRSKETFPLKAFYTLSHAKINKAVPLSKAEFIAKAMIVPAGMDENATIKFLERFCTMFEKIPCYELQFFPSASLWDVLLR